MRRCFFHVMKSHKANEAGAAAFCLMSSMPQDVRPPLQRNWTNTAGMGISCLSRDDEGTEMGRVLIGGT